MSACVFDQELEGLCLPGSCDICLTNLCILVARIWVFSASLVVDVANGVTLMGSKNELHYSKYVPFEIILDLMAACSEHILYV